MSTDHRKPEPIHCTPDKVFIHGVEQDKPTGFHDIITQLSTVTEKNDDPKLPDSPDDADIPFLPVTEYDPSKPYGGIDAQRDLEAREGHPHHTEDYPLSYEFPQEFAVSCRVFIENPDGPLSELGKIQMTRLLAKVRYELGDLGDDAEVVETTKLLRPASFKEFTVTVRGTSLEDIGEKLGIECPDPQLRSNLLCRKITAMAAEFHKPVDIVDRALQQQVQDDMNRGTWD